jgi:hypothetical protein
MNPISTAELTSIRSEVALAACDTPCTIQRNPNPAKDAWGSSAGPYNTISSPGLLVGMKQPTAGQLANYADMLGDLASWQVQLPYGTDVARLDHLLIGGQTLVVQVDLSPQSYNALTTVLATEIK